MSRMLSLCFFSCDAWAARMSIYRYEIDSLPEGLAKEKVEAVQEERQYIETSI